MILKGYIDDSADESVFVLAGYVAPAEEWVKFSDQWQKVLDKSPRVEHLHMTDAMSNPPSGEFYGISEESRDEKLSWFYLTIEEFVSFEVSVVIPMEAFKRVFHNDILPKQHKNPYYLAFSALMHQLTEHQVRIGMKEKIDFVFDEQPKEQQNVLDAWPWFVENMSPEGRSMIGSTPVFISDAKVLPLQAADMEAWWLRQRWRETLLGEERREYPWHSKPIPGVSISYDEDQLRDQHRLWVAFYNDRENLTATIPGQE